MPKRVGNAKIALINSALEIEKTEMSAEIRINEPQQMQMFLEEGNKMLKSMVNKIISAGANVFIFKRILDQMLAPGVCSTTNLIYV
jgi:chaperonin GroEL (HSP60 family)